VVRDTFSLQSHSGVADLESRHISKQRSNMFVVKSVVALLVLAIAAAGPSPIAAAEHQDLAVRDRETANGLRGRVGSALGVPPARIVTSPRQ
jgi:hypothetical protein